MNLWVLQEAGNFTTNWVTIYDCKNSASQSVVIVAPTVL
jgi:hypothetical protein